MNAPTELIVESAVTREFLHYVVPTVEPETWLRKQALLRDGRPTVGGLLLFAEEPQAPLPKRCGIKVYRYKTSEKEGFRDVLAFDPITVEGCLYDQIKEAVRKTTEVTESISSGEDSLERVQYPPETLHEIITNAVIHRDYSIADDVHIRIFDNRIEVQSPGRLPAHVTVKNILTERFARNGAIVRLLNKFPILRTRTWARVSIRHSKRCTNSDSKNRPSASETAMYWSPSGMQLAFPEEAIMRYLETNETIKNKAARGVTHISADYQIKNIFGRMVDKVLIEQVPGTRTSSTAYRKPRDSLPLTFSN